MAVNSTDSFIFESTASGIDLSMVDQLLGVVKGSNGEADTPVLVNAVSINEKLQIATEATPGIITADWARVLMALTSNAGTILTTTDSGSVSVGESSSNEPEGLYSMTVGQGLNTNNTGEVAIGVYNRSISASDETAGTMFSVGAGTSRSDRQNLFEIRSNGQIFYVNTDGESFELGDITERVMQATSRLTEIDTLIEEIAGNISSGRYNNGTLTFYDKNNSVVFQINGVPRGDEYQLPTATNSVKGGIKLGDGLKANNADSALIDINFQRVLEYIINTGKPALNSALNYASVGSYGVVKVGQGINVSNGVISVDSRTVVNTITNSSEISNDLISSIPSATSTTRGLIKVGEGLVMNGDKLSVNYQVVTNQLTNNYSADLNTAIQSASRSQRGVVKVGAGIGMSDADTICLDYPAIVNELRSTYNVVVDPDQEEYVLPIATTTVLGGIKLGNEFYLDGNSRLTLNQSQLIADLKTSSGIDLENIDSSPATANTAGSVKLGTLFATDSNGNLAINYNTMLSQMQEQGISVGSDYTLPKATASVLGGIKASTDLPVDSTGKISLNYANIVDILTGTYNILTTSSIPTATTTTKGAVIVGTGIGVSSTGVISVDYNSIANQIVTNYPDRFVGSVPEVETITPTSGVVSISEMVPNKEYIINGTPSSIVIGSYRTNNTNRCEYSIEFITGETAPTVDLPSSTLFNSTLNVKANKHYEISVKFNSIENKFYGLFAEW